MKVITNPQGPSSDLDRSSKLPRIVCYHQMHYCDGEFVSLLPLLDTDATHVIIAAIHLNSRDDIKLNDDCYDSPKNELVWGEVHTLQQSRHEDPRNAGRSRAGYFLEA